jgi:hypothetical protein
LLDLVLAAFLVCHISFSPFLFLFRSRGQTPLPFNGTKLRRGSGERKWPNFSTFFRLLAASLG